MMAVLAINGIGVEFWEQATIIHRIFEANSSFHVKWCTAGKISYLFFNNVLLVVAKISFWWGDWALGYHSVGFRHFFEIS